MFGLSNFLLLQREFFENYNFLIFVLVIILCNFMSLLHWNLIIFIMFKLASKCVHSVIFRILDKIVDHFACWVICPVLYFILCNLSQPKIIFLGKSIKNVNSHVWLAHLWNYCSVCTIPEINCSKFCWIASHQRFCPFKGMHMIFEWCHNMIFIKLRYPVKQSIQESGWIMVKCLTHTVDRNMIVNKFNLISVSLKWIDHEFLLVSKYN